MFFRLHFKCRFWPCFLDFWRQFGAPFGINFQKKTLPKMASKKGAPHIKTTPYEHVRRLPGRPPRVRASQTRNNSSSTNFKQCCSSSCSVFENAVLICFHCIFFQKCSKNWKESMSKTHYWLSDTPNRPKAWRINKSMSSAVPWKWIRSVL